MHKIAPLILLIVFGLFGCAPTTTSDAEFGFRGTGNETYQWAMDSTNSCTVWPIEEDWCCKISNTSSDPCEPKVGQSQYCARGWTEENVCIIPYEGNGDEWICIGSPSTCGVSGEDLDCFSTWVLSDSGDWTWEYVCLAWEVTCGGGGGNAEPCSTE